MLNANLVIDIKSKNKLRLNDSEENQDKEKTEIENKVFDDANDNGDHLGSLDDFLDQYK